MTKFNSIHSASFTLAAIATLAFATGCGGAVEQGTEDNAISDVGQSEAAFTFPIVTPTKKCLNSSTPASFSFHCDAQGFRRAGVFDGGSNTLAYNYASNPAPWLDETSYPSAVAQDPVDFDGSLMFGGFDLGRSVPSGMYRVDFISPDLLANANWQGKSTYRFRILEAYSISQVFGQIVLEVQKPDGTTTFFREVNAAGQSTFCNAVHGAWTDCTQTIPIPASHKVKSIQLRVFGNPSGAGEGIAFIDDVAPLN